MKNWKAILGVLLVFLLGALAGGLLVHGLYQKRIRAVLSGRAPGMAPDLMVRRLARELDLTPAQRVQVLGIIRDTHRQLRQTRQQVDPAIRTTLQQMQQRIGAVLTAEQQARFAQIMAARRARWPLLMPPPQPPPATEP